jgi:hypothetical protein
LRSQQAVQPPPPNFTAGDKVEGALHGTYLAAHVPVEAAGAGLAGGVEVGEVVAGGAEVAGGVVEAVLELLGGLLP